MEARKRKVSNIAGAFAGGSVIMNFLREPVATLGQVALYRVLATVVGSKNVEAILKSPGMKPSAARKILQTSLPQIMNAISIEFQHGPTAEEINGRLEKKMDKFVDDPDLDKKPFTNLF